MHKTPPLPVGSEISQVSIGNVDETLPNGEAKPEEIIPIVEEEVRVEKREVATGKVRVSTRVDIVTEPVCASLVTETVEVTRIPVDRVIDQMPDVRTENGVTIIPVVEEVLVVEKRMVLKEELHVRRNTLTENVDIPVELRKHKVEIERLSPAEDETTKK
jgi:stress response protein YsnF